MNVVICDDEQIYLQSAAKKIEDWANEHRVSNAVLVRTFRSSEDLLDAWENGLHIDMLFIDIQIPGEMSGMDVAKQILNFKLDLHGYGLLVVSVRFIAVVGDLPHTAAQQ